MTDAPTPGPKLLVLVGDWVEDYEAMVPIQALQMLGADVHVVSPGKTRGQLVMSCIHDFDRSHIDGATDVVFANNLGVTAGGQYLQYQAVSERYGHAVLITQVISTRSASTATQDCLCPAVAHWRPCSSTTRSSTGFATSTTPGGR